MNICKTQNCTGCMACMNCCPYDAIKEKQNERGFYVPAVDEERCKQCGLCQRVCPANSPKITAPPPDVFACWNKDAEVRRYSTSGGIFTLLGRTVLDQGGVVFGVVFDQNSEVVQHQKAETPEELRAMVGSKYVQSRIGHTYRMVKSEIETGRPVLFAGTPCQCDGLKKYLREQPDNLYLLDLVCHGVPSPAVLKKYLAELSHGKTIQNINFREKRPSWELYSMQMSFSGEKEYLSDMNHDAFLRLFSGNYCLNDCCHACPYASISRCGDITLGDFWGYLSESHALRDDSKGINLVLINTSKGRRLFDKVKQDAVCTEKKIDEAIAGNSSLAAPTPRASESDAFWNEFLMQSAVQTLTVLKKAPMHQSVKHKIRLYLDRHYYLLPVGLKQKYRRVKLHNAEEKRSTVPK